jgi:hypothetical protein
MRVTHCAIARLETSFPRLGVSSYQRATVWKPEQKGALIRSLLSDIPTGAVILNNLGAGGSKRKAATASALAAGFDIIDGQQRLTTIFEFLRGPAMYFDWAPNSPKPTALPEPRLLQDSRQTFNQLRKLLSSPKENYIPPQSASKALRARVIADTNRLLVAQARGQKLSDPRFFPLVSSITRACQSLGRKHIVIEELRDVLPEQAEAIYHLVNTGGTELLWWELLWGNPRFVHEDYDSTTPYQTTRLPEVQNLGILYRGRSVLRIHAGGTNSSFWHALLALGEYAQFLLAQRDPSVAQQLLKRGERRINVDGLGFRMVSVALSHDISRAAISRLFDEFSNDQIRRAIDTLFDAIDVLLKAPSQTSPNYLLFQKLASFHADPIPAYPLVGLIVAAAKLVDKNKSSGHGPVLTASDQRALRCLTEELFREVICTSQWAGTGDTHLKNWLDRHFFDARAQAHGSPGILGGPRNLNPTYSGEQWLTRIRGLRLMEQRRPTRECMALQFWVQYLFDATVPGCLPKGDVQFDHIVAYSDVPQSPASHPLNIAAIRSSLNRSKGLRSYVKWSPQGLEDDEYRLNVLCQVPAPGIPGSASTDFLRHADLPSIHQLLEARRKTFEFAVGPLLRDWITNGES